jgi:hypothetical protein
MLARILYGYKGTQCLYVAAKLNIADHLSSGNKSVSELAKLTNSKTEALYRVLRCLAALGIFTELPEKTFSLNEAAEELRTDSESTLKDFVILCGEELYQAVGDLLYSVNTGKPAFNSLYGKSHWQYLEEHPDKARIFHDALAKGSLPILREIISHYDFSPYHNIIDVGGGKGHLLCEVLAQYPHANGTVFDLNNAKDIALEYIKQLDITDRCNFISGDFFKSVPAGDLYLLKVVLHDWDDRRAKEILSNCRQSISKSGRLLIIEKIIGDDKYNDLACLGDINMLVTQTGRERSLGEFTDLLDSTGFKMLRKIDTSTVFSIIEAEPVMVKTE